MKSILLSSLCLLLFIAAGCKSPAAKVNQISTGMSKAQVVAILGQPHNTTAVGERETLHYSLLRYRPPIRVPIHEDYQVILDDGHVAAFGKPRDLARMLPKAIPEKTVNVNIHSTTNTAPVQPNVNVNTQTQ